MRAIGCFFVLALLCDQSNALGQVMLKVMKAQAVQVEIEVGAEVEAVAMPDADADADADAKDEDKPKNQKEAPECLRPLINIELSFVKRICDPSEEQMTAIIAATKEAHKAMADVVKPQGADMAFKAGAAMFMGPNQERITVNPYHRIRQDMAKLLEPLVSADQYAKYIEESKLRDIYEREAALGIVLDMIDSRLVLTGDQRRQIFEKLMANWKEVDLLWLQNYRHNPQYLPSMPEDQIVPVLTDSQKKLWKDANQQKVTMFSSLNQGNVAGFTEEWLKP